MNRTQIEKYYEKKDYEAVFKELSESINKVEDIHTLRLFIRSANELKRDIANTITSDDIQNDPDYLLNKFMFCNETEEMRRLSEELLGAIFASGREELLDEMLLLHLEKLDVYPIYSNYFEYIITHSQKPVIAKYLSSVSNEKDILFTVIRSKLLSEDCSKVLEKEVENIPYIHEAFQAFISNEGIDLDAYSLFKKSMTFKNGMFVILENEIYKILKYDVLTKLFLLKDKFERTKNADIKTLATKTNPIESDDFRVYKFFNPEKAKDLEVCQLLTMILKYRQTAIDKGQLKDELSHIFSTEAGRWITKNRKKFEECENVEIMYEKTERYLYSLNASKDIVQKAMKVKTVGKLIEIIEKTKSQKKLTDDEISGLTKIALKFKDPERFEAVFIMSGDVSLAANIKDVSEAVRIHNGEFKRYVVLSLIESGKSIEELIPVLTEIDADMMEAIYATSIDKVKKDILKTAEKALRLKKNLVFLMWYGKYHLLDKLMDFSDDYITERIIDIADELISMKTGSEFVQFARKSLFSGKKYKFLSILENLSDENGRRLFKTFEKAKFLTDYQRDEIRTEVFKKHPEYREAKTEEYQFSTKESIYNKQKYLDDLVNEKIPEMSSVIKEAASLGDLAENSEYKFAREKYGLLSKEAEKLKAELSKSQPIDMEIVKGDRVEAGVIVKFLNSENNETKEYTVLGPLDVDFDRNVISYLSPLVQKILGMKKGMKKDNIEILNIDKIK